MEKNLIQFRNDFFALLYAISYSFFIRFFDTLCNLLCHDAGTVPHGIISEPPEKSAKNCGHYLTWSDVPG
jgi:hypothetical protein